MHAVQRMLLRRANFFAALVVLVGGNCFGAESEEGARFFREKIQLVLEKNCFECHSADAKKVKGELLLDTAAGLRKGGETGPAIVPGDAKKSLLIQAIRHEGDLQMPPKKPKLSDDVIADFVKWVDMGAPDPRAGAGSVAEIDWKKAREFWSFRPVTKPALPRVKDSSWARTPIDLFVLEKLEGKGLRP